MTNHKRLLIVSQYYSPDITAAAFRIEETAAILCSKGYDITVITAKPHRAAIDTINDPENSQIKTIRVPIIKYHGKGKWDYTGHYFSFMIMAIVASLFRTRSKYDIVFASSPPLFVGVAGYLIAKLKRAKFILDVRDLWPDTAVVAGQLKQENRLYKWAKITERWLYRKAHLLSCVAEPMAKYIRNHVAQDKVVVIYNGVSQRYLNSNDLNDKNWYGLLAASKINVVYVGNMGHLQELQLLLEAAKQIKAEGIDDIVFYLVGSGAEKRRLKQLKLEYGLNNVIISNPVSKIKAIELICKSSALFLQLKDGWVMEKTIPSKLFDYMIGGKPILFGIKGEGKKILENSKGNIYFEPGSIKSLVDAIKALKENYSYLRKCAKENKIALQKYYMRETLTNKLETSIQQLF